MMLHRIAALAIVLGFCCVPAHAQDESFATFVKELWPDAQAKAITRATFDLALKGVTPDPRVIAATKRQPSLVKFNSSRNQRPLYFIEPAPVPD